MWRTASTRLFCVAFFGAIIYTGHWALLRLWPRLALTRARPLPEVLVFPRIEVMYWEATLVGVMQALAMLMAGEQGRWAGPLPTVCLHQRLPCASPSLSAHTCTPACTHSAA